MQLKQWLMPGRLAGLLLVCWLTVGCAPLNDSLTPQQRTADLQRLEQLKIELIRLKAELRKTQANEQQERLQPEATSRDTEFRRCWSTIDQQSQPLDDQLKQITVLATAPANEALVRLLTLIETRPDTPCRATYLVPSLQQPEGLSSKTYDFTAADRQLKAWPKQSSGPWLKVALPAPAADGSLLLDLEGLNSRKVEMLLSSLEDGGSLNGSESEAQLIAILRTLPEQTARVTPYHNNFILSWQP